MYSISLDGQTVQRVAEVGPLIRLKYAEFDPIRHVPTVEPELTADAFNSLYVVQFETQPLEDYRQALVNAGATIYDFLPDQCYIVKMSGSAAATVARQEFVRWVGPYQPAYRVDPELRPALLEGTLPTQRYNVQVFERGLGQQNLVKAFIELLGGTVHSTNPEGFLVQATLTPVQLRQVLFLNEVAYVDRWSAPEDDMSNIRIINGANYVVGLENFKGQGVRAEVMDGGLRRTHVDYQHHPPLMHTSASSSSHGTATYGINFGDGTANASGMGILPMAQGVFASYNSVSNRHTHTAQLLQSPYFCVYQSNSWGSSLTTQYNTTSAEMDDILFLNDITILQSQSNAGSTSSRPQAWAKNIVSIGGFFHFNNTNRADDRWNGGASTGPAADGRIKPDLSNAYDQVFTTTSTSDTAYTSSFGGTSAATPITAGHFGLFFQMWNEGVFGNPALGSTVFDNRPKAPLAKAFMINSAFMYELPPTTDLSRVRQGWGAVDAQNLYDRRDGFFYVNETDVLQNLQTKTYHLWVNPGQPHLRVTMIYTDPAGTPGAGVARKNNLSLRVTSPGGVSTYWGNSGLSASNWSSPGGAENLVDTVENVFVQSPASGAWRIEVIGSDINTDARTETVGVVDADFALVASGGVPSILPSSVSSPNLQSGSLADLMRSDNKKTTSGLGGPIRSEINTYVEGTAPTDQLASLALRLEASSNVSCNYTVFFWDYVAGEWDQVGAGPTVLTDGLGSGQAAAARYIEAGTKKVKSRIRWTISGGVDRRNWKVFLDQVRWFVSP